MIRIASKHKFKTISACRDSSGQRWNVWAIQNRTSGDPAALGTVLVLMARKKIDKKVILVIQGCKWSCLTPTLLNLVHTQGLLAGGHFSGYVDSQIAREAIGYQSGESKTHPRRHQVVLKWEEMVVEGGFKR